MKYLICIGLLSICLSAKAQEDKSPYLEQVSSLDKIMHSLYDVISGDAGVERDWDLFKYLFHKDAKLMPTRVDQNGNVQVYYLTPQDYIDRSGPWLIQNGFHELETHREVDEFAHIVQVFSTYEAFKSKKDKEAFMTGINSIQLSYDGTRYWILNIYWEQASKDYPIPDKYLPH